MLFSRTPPLTLSHSVDLPRSLLVVILIFNLYLPYRKASVRTTSQETKAKSLIQYTFIYLHRRIIRNQKSQNQSNAWLMLGGREQGGTKKTIHYLENSSSETYCENSCSLYFLL